MAPTALETKLAEALKAVTDILIAICPEDMQSDVKLNKALRNSNEAFFEYLTLHKK